MVAVIVLVVASATAIVTIHHREPSHPSTTSSTNLNAQVAHTTTATKIFAPWTQAGQLAPGIQVDAHLTNGSCSIGSIADGANQDAWRCFSGTGVYDPCFAPPGNPLNVTLVACALSPLSGVDMLTLATPLPSSSGGTTVNTGPWFMQLRNGEMCVQTGSAVSSADGVTFVYDCRNNPMGKVFGGANAPNTSTEPWTVKYLPNSSHVISEVDVTTAWT